MSIILYTIGCPLCNRLESMLDEAGISYEKVTDRDVMIEKGLMASPILEVEGKRFTYAEAKLWIGERVKNAN